MSFKKFEYLSDEKTTFYFPLAPRCLAGGGGEGGANGSGREGHSAAAMLDSVAISSPAEGPLTSLSVPPHRSCT